MRIPAQIDMGMAMSIHICRLNCGEDLKPVAVEIMHDAPPCAEQYFALFKAPVQFSADRDNMTFSFADEVSTTFRTLLETVRKDLASMYVHDPDIELAEVAFLLGFSDHSAFSRAFRRWTRHSPSETRKSG